MRDPQGAEGLAGRLRLMVITRPDPAGGLLRDVVAECIEAGATAIQLRDKNANSRELYTTAMALAPIVRSGGALFIVNDRFDVAIAAEADGVHLGPEDIPVAAARHQLTPDFLVGYSTDDPAAGARAASDGADYLGVGAVFGTVSKAGLSEEAIGVTRVAEVGAAAGLPVVGVGGITAHNAASLARLGAGIAVLGAVMNSSRPAEAVRELKRAMGQRG